MAERSDEKFHVEDLPKILTALKEARERKEPASVMVQFASDGGVISVILDSKKKFK